MAHAMHQPPRMRAASAPWSETVPVHRRPKKGAGAVLGTTLLAFALGLCGVSVYYFHKRATVAEGRVTAERMASASTRARAAELDKKLARAEEDLQVAEAGFAAETEKLQAERDTAAAKAAQAAALADKLKQLVKGDDGGVTVDQDRLTLSLVDKVLFASGEAYLTPKGEKVLAKVGAALKDVPHQIWIQGHTDDVPITRRDQFESNWELSSARALTVVHYLQDDAKIDARRLAAVGFGQYRPVSKRNKAANRRIEIVLFPQDVKLAKE